MNPASVGPLPAPQHDPYDDQGALRPAHNGSGKATNASFDDAEDGYTLDIDHPENGLLPLPQPKPKPKQRTLIGFFQPQPKPPPAPPISSEDQTALNMKYEQLEQVKKKKTELLAAVVSKWELRVTERKWGRRSRDELFNDALLQRVQQLVQEGATASAFEGPKPQRPENWTVGDTIVFAQQQQAQQAAPPQDAPAPPQDAAPEPQPAGVAPAKVAKKRGAYKKRSDEVKYLFWELHREWKHATVQETINRVNAEMPETFQAPLKDNTVFGWQEFKVRPPPQPPPAEKQKPGPKKRKLPVGEFVPWHNLRVPVEVLVMLSGMIMALLTAGVPITTGVCLSMAFGLFASKGITWKPSTSWSYTFLHRLGLAARRGTRPARALPSDFELVKDLFLKRVVWVVATFTILSIFFFNLDETGMRFMPLKDRTWSAMGAAQVDISNLGDKRQFTVVPVVDAIGNLVYTQVIWQGKSAASCPSAAIQLEHQDVLAHTQSQTHWSTPTTMELLVDNLWNKYVKPKMQALGMNILTTPWCITWDVYSSHRDQTLLDRLAKKYPYLIILFIPATCTSMLQPLDVGFNYDFKSIITALACAWLSLNVSRQLTSGVAPEAVTVPHTKGELVAPFCSWLAAACRKMNTADRRHGTLRAWEKTGMSIAWDHENPQRRVLFEEAKKMADAGTLWQTHSARRSQKGKVPRTLLTVAGNVGGGAGNVGMHNVEKVDAEDEEEVEQPEDFTVIGDQPPAVLEQENGQEELKEKKEEEPQEEEESEQLPAVVLVDMKNQVEAAKKTRAGRTVRKPAKFQA